MISDKILILGSGPAGMGCAYALGKGECSPFVIEKDSEPGGLCRTLNFGGYLFDIGGHRFLSSSKEINQLWLGIMGDDILQVKRLSRIFYKKRFFNYPLSFYNTLWNLGLAESTLCVASYLKNKLFKSASEDTFENWIINRFGKRLYDIFFKVYTEKVWATACRDISADWARHRIQGLSLKVAVQKALLGMRQNTPKTLCEEFLYPRTGPGEFYQRFYNEISKMGTQFNFNKEVRSIKHNNKNVLLVETQNNHTNEKRKLLVDYLFSSISLPAFMELLDPAPPKTIKKYSRNLHFRSLLVVNIILDKEHVFPDQWLYVHSPEVRLGRIQNYKNWSSAMTADTKKTSLGLEYFCTEGDSLWNMNDVDLINYAAGEIEKIGIASRRHLINGFVVRRPNVYPIYSLDYQKNVNIIRNYLKRFRNLQMIGRGGLFRYSNSDHALLTGMYAARNFLGKGSHDVWNMNAEEAYIES